MKNFLFLIFIMVFLVSSNSDVFAQCAMCKAVASSNIDTEANNVGKGLNTGILYLMAIPYMLLMGLFYLFFKDKIKEKIKAIKF